jgi:tryptophanyl-tRNA synthetase
VVDLHALTVAHDPVELTSKTRELATLLLASGIDPDRSLLFVQSHVGGVHAECTWILNCVATFGELRRMTQFKEKGGGQESVSVGLFDYPVLMAADILLYDTDEVPVGDDQRQHVELTRDIAVRFNHHFGDTFVIPKATFPPAGARVMDLQQPVNKMSKSDDSPQGTVLVLDDPKLVERKIKSAVTDSETEVRYDTDAKPGVSNLLDIYAAAARTTVARCRGHRRVPAAGTRALRGTGAGSGRGGPTARAGRRRRGRDRVGRAEPGPCCRGPAPARRLAPRRYRATALQRRPGREVGEVGRAHRHAGDVGVLLAFHEQTADRAARRR